MGWGGGLILSKAQKSATAPAHLLLVCAVSELAKKSKCCCDRLSEWFDGFKATVPGQQLRGVMLQLWATGVLSNIPGLPKINPTVWIL